MSSVKSKLNPLRHRICMMEGEISMTNCAKRRGSSPNPEQQPHATSLVDQPDTTPATTTTVKRSSKFPSVSRFDLLFLCVPFSKYVVLLNKLVFQKLLDLKLGKSVPSVLYISSSVMFLCL